MSESDLRADIQAHLATIAVLQDRERVWQGELEREVAKREALEKRVEVLEGELRLAAHELAGRTMNSPVVKAIDTMFGGGK